MKDLFLFEIEEELFVQPFQNPIGVLVQCKSCESFSTAKKKVVSSGFCEAKLDLEWTFISSLCFGVNSSLFNYFPLPFDEEGGTITKGKQTVAKIRDIRRVLFPLERFL